MLIRGTQELRGPYLSDGSDAAPAVASSLTIFLILHHQPYSRLRLPGPRYFLILVGSHIEKKNRYILYTTTSKKVLSYKGKEKDYEGGSSSGSWNNLFQGEKNNTLAIHYRSSSPFFFSTWGFFFDVLGSTVCRVLLLLGAGSAWNSSSPPSMYALGPKGDPRTSLKDTPGTLLVRVWRRGNLRQNKPPQLSCLCLLFLVFKLLASKNP